MGGANGPYTKSIHLVDQEMAKPSLIFFGGNNHGIGNKFYKSKAVFLGYDS